LLIALAHRPEIKAAHRIGELTPSLDEIFIAQMAS
jgi:hypothetical protein